VGLFLAQRDGEGDSLSDSLIGTVAGLETLARVTLLATDKTGAPTTGALGAFAAADPHPDPTIAAIGAARPRQPGSDVRERIPFASADKYSAADFNSEGAWYLGAPEVVLGADSIALEAAQTYADAGMRVLVVGKAGGLQPAGTVPPTRSPTSSRGVRRRGRRPVDRRPHAVFGRVTPDVKRKPVKAAQSRGGVVAMTGDGVNDTLELKDADLAIGMGSGTSAAKSVAG
jgi:cation-transporting ATPase E